MLFNSFEFSIFLPVVFCLYWFVFNKSLRAQNILLLVASYFFYGWWSYKFLGLLVLSTVLDFAYGFGVASASKRKAKFYLVLSLINNLGILGIFKYYNFFALQFQQGFELLGWHCDPILLNVALPIGISFYTFHGMSYVFDIYRGHQKPIKNFIDYAVFVSFFPLLVAGPIERAHHLLPQIQRKRWFNYTQAAAGCRLILWGMFKKVVIADNLAISVNYVFQNYHTLNAVALIIGAIAFSFQIYGDFSGYSDIAIGTAKLFGIELLSNFKFPYFSRDIAEFWRRWHISLSSWFRDYLYIPLGGSKEGVFKAVRNTFIIFIVSGFWHGANWTFIAWGTIHACCFLPLLLAKRNRKHVSEIVAQDKHLPNFKELSQILSTFILVTISWIFFRSNTISDAFKYIGNINLHNLQLSNTVDYLANVRPIIVFSCIASLLFIDWWLRRDERNLRTIHSKFRYVLYFIMIDVIISQFGGDTKFIYFQF